MATGEVGREVRLVSRPVGEPVPENFELVEVPLGELDDGQVRVANRYMSVDPYMRGRMNDVASYVPPFELGAALTGSAVGEVVASRSERFRVGDVVVHGLGWRDVATGPAEAFAVVDGAAPLSHYLGILGMPGLTAYAGLVEVARLAPSEVVFVSGAAGAVGSAAGQMARLLGAGRVIGSAGSETKVRYLIDELGFDAAFDYHSGKVARLLAEAAPDGIDVYFDNVGGDHLEAAISAMRDFGRVAACGAVSAYNATGPVPGPRNLGLVVGRRLTIRGFIVGDHAHLRAELLERVGGWIRDGSLVVPETFVDGLDHAAHAFIGMLRGENIGKMVVRLHPPA
ncbi:MAG: NADP-dependent oxidoreductase [Acidimicrobiales bacterium]